MIKTLKLKHIKVPKKIVVVQDGISSINLTVTHGLSIFPQDPNQIRVYAEYIPAVHRLLSLEEAIEFMIILETTGYNDFFGKNFIFTKNKIYFIDTEHKAFSPNNPAWSSIKTIESLLEPKDVEQFRTEFAKRKKEFENKQKDRTHKKTEYKKFFEKNPYSNLANVHQFQTFRISLSEL